MNNNELKRINSEMREVSMKVIDFWMDELKKPEVKQNPHDRLKAIRMVSIYWNKMVDLETEAIERGWN